MQVSNFRVTLQSDSGKHSLTTSASSAEAAKAKVIAAENCPPSAVLSAKPVHVNKYDYAKVIQQNYGQGWEDVSEYHCNSAGIVTEMSGVFRPSKFAGRPPRELTLLQHDKAEYELTGYATRVISRKTLRPIANA